MADKFIDDKIVHIEDDIEKVQTKPNMYISYLGARGALHLTKEIINNAIDECINDNSPGDTIDIYLNENENMISVTDNGRGIPPESLDIVCTTLQSGSKMQREGTGSSAGENGVGLTACNALAELFEIIVYRYGERWKISFTDGKQTGPISKTSISDKNKHASVIIMKPSKFFLGEDCEISADELTTWVDKISYLLPTNIKLNLSIEKKGRESLVTKKYVNKHGIYDYVKKLCDRPLLDPIKFTKTLHLKEKNRDKEFDRFMRLDVAFTFSSSGTDLVVDSFCNFVNTVDNGVHVDAVKTAILQYLSKQTRDMLSERDAKKFDIIYADVSQGLALTVNLQTDFQPQFTGQTKEKLSNDGFFKPIRDMTYRGLVEYFKDLPKDLKRVTDRIRLNAKARYESTKVRNSVIRGETTNFEEHMMENFEPANNKGKNDYRELFIIEGKSARGSASSGRFDKDTQALFSLRGVPLNAFGVDINKVLLNNEFKCLVQILGCNIGERFDITKLKYRKIIIMADSDADGYNITSMICAFFITHMPEIVKGGYLYKAVAPLYRIKSKYKEFILNKREYVQIFERQIRDNVRVIDPDTNHAYSDAELQNLLFINQDYLEELHRIASHLAIDADLLEYIAIHNERPDFKKIFHQKYSELTIDDDNVMSGIYNGHYQILIMDSLFQKRLAPLKHYIHDVNHDKMYYIIHEVYGTKSEQDKGLMSIGDFLTMCEKFQPVIQTRYKGLAELQPSDLCDTTLDPNKRMLIRLTIDDINRDLAKFNILHGNDSDERRLLMEHFKINREDLDN